MQFYLFNISSAPSYFGRRAYQSPGAYPHPHGLNKIYVGCHSQSLNITRDFNKKKKQTGKGHHLLIWKL
jgi:hypothetical protein